MSNTNDIRKQFLQWFIAKQDNPELAQPDWLKSYDTEYFHLNNTTSAWPFASHSGQAIRIIPKVKGKAVKKQMKKAKQTKAQAPAGTGLSLRAGSAEAKF